MRKNTFIATCVSITILLLASDASGQYRAGDEIETERRAQTGMKFLDVSVNARAAALGGAAPAQEMGSASMFYNPAGMANVSSFSDVSVSHFQWLADHEYNAGTVAFRPASGRYGVFGFSLLSVSYSEVIETVRSNNSQGFTDLGTFSPSALAAGAGYAIALTDRFSVGGHAKYVRQSLGSSTMSLDESGDPSKQENAASTVAFDFGIIYETGFRSLDFALDVRNFSSEVTHVEESFELPLTLRMGLSMDMMDLTQLDSNTHSLLLSIDAERPRDYYDQVKVGGEYTFMNTLALRGGYAFPTDEHGVSLGGGVNLSFSGIDFSVDYAYTAFGILGNVNRMGVRLAI